jgi:hypothetical protein
MKRSGIPAGHRHMTGKHFRDYYFRDHYLLPDESAERNDAATTSLIEVWITQTERRTWFQAETINESREV